MSTESNATPVNESPKPSVLTRIKNNAIAGGITLVPVAIAGVSMYVGTRKAWIDLETAKLNLETAKLAHKA